MGVCIEDLQLLGNPVCECDDVKEKVKAYLPNLKTVDGENL